MYRGGTPRPTRKGGLSNPQAALFVYIGYARSLRPWGGLHNYGQLGGVGAAPPLHFQAPGITGIALKSYMHIPSGSWLLEGSMRVENCTGPMV